MSGREEAQSSRDLDESAGDGEIHPERGSGRPPSESYGLNCI